ncbi:MAG: serine/threonine protein kinase/formylglycine-generating enzyme required for sulfatase activity [Planctomycetota bacterium]
MEPRRARYPVPMDSNSDIVYELLDSFLAQRKEGAGLEFEEWAANYSDHTEALCAAWENWQLAAGDLEANPNPYGTSVPFGPGQEISKFTLIRHLGGGGQADVWEAEQAELGRRVALKLLRPDRVSARDLALFQREARAGARLRNESVVAVYDYGQEGEIYWIAQELVPDGRTLRNRIDEARQGAVADPTWYTEVAQLVQRIAAALQLAHDAGIVHRDIKPQNILLTPDGSPKVGDFGLARVEDTSALSQSGQLVGTYLYMSPEQVAAHTSRIDHRTDIFSLGVVLYEMLTLMRPFDGDTAHQICTRILQREPPEPRLLFSRIPRELSVICCKALEKDVGKRYANMSALSEDLDRFLTHRPILAKPPTTLERGLKWIRRNPTKSVAVALASVAFVVISGMGVRLAQSNSALGLSISAEKQNAELARLNAEAATENAVRANENAIEAQRVTADVLRLSISQDYGDLIASQAELWPAYPEQIDALRTWIEEAEGLVDQLPQLVDKRDELRLLAEEQSKDGETSWEFPADADSSRWWNSQLTELIEKLESLHKPGEGLLTENGLSPERGWCVPYRLRLAEVARDEFADDGEWAARWAAAIPAIQRTYPLLNLHPQPGLVPIGDDPDSGLLEFWHVQSGEEPLRDETGALFLQESSGLVFVLLPGGKFWMGAQSTSPDGRNFDPDASLKEGPPHEVELSAFFLSKYEMTQGQWKRAVGANPSLHGPDAAWEQSWNEAGAEASLLHPIEMVNWLDCKRVLARLGLQLPSEAQWEFGARAGTASVWASGSDVLSLEGMANIADEFLRREGSSLEFRTEAGFEDGHCVHSPVGSFEANAFGLHDVHGNLWEWCLDGWCDNYYSSSPKEDPVCPPGTGKTNVWRGGSFDWSAVFARSALRDDGARTGASPTLGVRPAKAIQ